MQGMFLLFVCSEMCNQNVQNEKKTSITMPHVLSRGIKINIAGKERLPTKTKMYFLMSLCKKQAMLVDFEENKAELIHTQFIFISSRKL